MTTFHGYVQAPESMFKTVDGKTTFHPINDHYATVTPGEAPAPETNNAWWRSETPPARNVEFELNAGEYFQVREEIDKCEARMGTKPAGNFLDYGDAFRAAAGKNAQGGRGAIVIMYPAGTEETTALDAEGNTVMLETRISWHATGLASRLRFL